MKAVNSYLKEMGMKKTSAAYHGEAPIASSVVNEPIALESYVSHQNYSRLYQAIRHVAFSYQQLFEYVMSWLDVPGITLEKSKPVIIGDLMEVSESTVYRWRTNAQSVNTKHVERLTELMDVYLYGAEVLGSRQDFIRWLALPNVLLSHSTPMSHLDGATGLKLVRHMLDKIQYGAPL